MSFFLFLGKVVKPTRGLVPALADAGSSHRGVSVVLRHHHDGEALSDSQGRKLFLIGSGWRVGGRSRRLPGPPGMEAETCFCGLILCGCIGAPLATAPFPQDALACLSTLVAHRLHRSERGIRLPHPPILFSGPPDRFIHGLPMAWTRSRLAGTSPETDWSDHSDLIPACR